MKKQMNWKAQMKLGLIVAVLAAGAIGCGSEPAREGDVNIAPPVGVGGPGWTPVPIPTSTGGPVPGLPSPFTYDFTISGPGGATPSYITPTISTDSIFKVRVRAGGAGSNAIPGYGSYNLQFGCVRYKITVSGEARETPVLKVPGSTNSWMCPNAPESVEMDFSNRTGSASGLRVQVSNAQTSFLCPYFVGTIYQSNYCPVSNANQNHTVKGQLVIQTNGTGPTY